MSAYQKGPHNATYLTVASGLPASVAIQDETRTLDGWLARCPLVGFQTSLIKNNEMFLDGHKTATNEFPAFQCPSCLVP